MASRRLADLHPIMQAKAEEFLKRAAARGIDVLIYCTHRPDAEQAAEYAKGRTRPGKVVTNARPGESPHNATLKGKPAALAWDCVPRREGRALWDDIRAYRTLGEIAEAIGLSWGGRWPRLCDRPHMELPGWKVLLAQQRKAGDKA